MTAYAGLAESYAAGPEPVYDRMSDALVAACSPGLDGALVLDLGSGTGATSRALRRVGARSIAVDLEIEMLRQHRSDRPPAVLGDIARLPFASQVFGATLAAFCLSHHDQPGAVLAEASRVTLAGGTVAVMGFNREWPDPVKAAIDERVRAFGWTPPDWYVRMREADEASATAERLAALARSGGLVESTVHREEVDVGLETAEAIVRYRLGAPHVAAFVDALAPERRASLEADAEQAVRRALGPEPIHWRPAVLILTARVSEWRL